MPKDTSEVEKLMKRMYRLWNIRPRSEKEVRDYFKRLSVSSSIVDTIVERLKQLRLLNDEEFAKAWVEARKKKKGPRVLKQELFQKGIDREIIEQVISDKGEVISQEATASQLLEKKIKLWKNLPDLKKKKKAYRFLLSRGFDYDLVKTIVEKLSKIN